PNRCFPVDTAHGPDSMAMNWEKTFAARTGVTIHRPWGENFLWGYSRRPAVPRRSGGRGGTGRHRGPYEFQPRGSAAASAGACVCALAPEVPAWYRLQPLGRGAY